MAGWVMTGESSAVHSQGQRPCTGGETLHNRTRAGAGAGVGQVDAGGVRLGINLTS